MVSKKRVLLPNWIMLLQYWGLNMASIIQGSSNGTSCPSVCFCDDVSAYVSCVGDGLWNVPTDLPTTAERLELRNFVISTLENPSFETLTDLQELKLQQSRLNIIENGALSHLSKLTRLDLAQNGIENLTSGVFEGMQNLRYLDLSSNFLLDIEGAFEGLSNVEQLNLRSNRLPYLTSRTLKGLQKVQYLNLDLNAIASIDVDAFQYLTNLAHLILSNNPLRTLSRLDFFGARLQYVDVSNIGLTRVPQSLTKFVRDLRLAKNNITRIAASDFDSYPYLGLLVLDDNSIMEIENDALGRQEYLLRLWLNGNKLTRVPGNLPASLLALYMEENLLKEIQPYNFRGLVSLEQLFLQRNRISILSPCAFCNLENLKSLDLQANQIEFLNDGVFANLSRLEMLDLSQNGLRVLSSRCFYGLDNLRTLQMSRVSNPVTFEDNIFDSLQKLQNLEMYDSSDFVHKIVSSTRVLHGIRRVQELNIMHNKLSGLRSDFPSFFPHLKVIKLSGNSWYCGPNITWLASWIKISNIQFYRSYNIRCASPARLQLKPIMLLNQDDLAVPAMSIPETTSTLTLSSTSTTTADPEKTTLPVTVTSTFQLQTLTDNTHTDSTVINNYTLSLTNSFENVNTTYENILFPDFNITTASTKPKSFPAQVTPTLIYSEMSMLTETVTTSSRNVSLVQRLYLTPVRLSPSPVNYQWSQVTAITISTALTGSCLIIVLAVAALITTQRCRRHETRPAKPSAIRRSSSISYHPQRDEVSIITVSEGTVGWKTSTHHGLGNKLYYALEDVDIMSETNTFTT